MSRRGRLIAVTAAAGCLALAMFIPNADAARGGIPGRPTPKPSKTTASPTSTASPSPTAEPSPTPTSPPTGWPDASNTGVPAGTVLSAYTGPTTITTAGTVIDAQLVTDCLVVKAPGVRITRSRLAAACFYVVDAYPAQSTWLVIEDSEITCNDTNGTAIGEEGVVATRVNVHGCENGFDINHSMTITDSYIHDLTQTGADPHTDGAQVWPGAHDVVFRHNSISAKTGTVNGTSAIITPDLSNGSVTDIRVENNLLGGGAYTLYCPRNPPAGYSSSFYVTGNRFTRDAAYGPWTDCEDEILSGNVWDDDGTLITP